MAYWKPVTRIQLLLTSPEMSDDSLWGFAESAQALQPSGPSQYVPRGIQKVGEANQDASYTRIPSMYALKSSKEFLECSSQSKGLQRPAEAVKASPLPFTDIVVKETSPWTEK